MSTETVPKPCQTLSHALVLIAEAEALTAEKITSLVDAAMAGTSEHQAQWGREKWETVISNLARHATLEESEALYLIQIYHTNMGSAELIAKRLTLTAKIIEEITDIPLLVELGQLVHHGDVEIDSLTPRGELDDRWYAREQLTDDIDKQIDTVIKNAADSGTLDNLVQELSPYSHAKDKYNLAMIDIMMQIVKNHTTQDTLTGESVKKIIETMGLPLKDTSIMTDTDAGWNDVPEKFYNAIEKISGYETLKDSDVLKLLALSQKIAGREIPLPLINRVTLKTISEITDIALLQKILEQTSQTPCSTTSLDRDIVINRVQELIEGGSVAPDELELWFLRLDEAYLHLYADSLLTQCKPSWGNRYQCAYGRVAPIIYTASARALGEHLTPELLQKCSGASYEGIIGKLTEEKLAVFVNNLLPAEKPQLPDAQYEQYVQYPQYEMIYEIACQAIERLDAADYEPLIEKVLNVPEMPHSPNKRQRLQAKQRAALIKLAGNETTHQRCLAEFGEEYTREVGLAKILTAIEEARRIMAQERRTPELDREVKECKAMIEQLRNNYETIQVDEHEINAALVACEAGNLDSFETEYRRYMPEQKLFKSAWERFVRKAKQSSSKVAADG